MKRLIFSSIFILIAFLFSACRQPFSPSSGELSGGTSRQIEGDVTIYLDGNGPAPAARALSRTLAMMACDYFEVTFLYNTDSTPAGYIAARGDWRIGESAGVSGVFRTPAGVYYDSASAPASGKGSAILFAGKGDKTLLAVGHLYMVDGQPGTRITSDTKSVTFMLHALTAGVDGNASDSSFLTAIEDSIHTDVSAANTKIIPVDIGGKEFPLFKLEAGLPTIRADYKFELHSGDFNDYGGICIAAAGSIERKQPRYTLPDGNIQTKSTLILDTNTEITLFNNNTPGASFNNTVEFIINTVGTTNGSMFSFVFSIPVYALADGSRWFIRPGYGTNQYDLDDGTSEMGGAVLIGTGDIEVAAGNYKIIVEVPPLVWYYGYNDDRTFTISGLQVDLINELTGQTVIANIPYDDLTFRLGNTVIVPDFYIFGNEFYGSIEVTVEYQYPVGTGPILQDVFYVLISSQNNDFSNINPAFIYHIWPDNNGVNSWNFATFMNGIPAATGNTSETIIFVLHTDVILAGCNPNFPVPYLLFFVAAEPNLSIKRQGGAGPGASITVWGGQPSLNAFWFGVWPFNETGLSILGFPTYPYTIDTTNRYDVGGVFQGGGPYTERMIIDGQNPSSPFAMYNVRVDPRINVVGNLLY